MLISFEEGRRGGRSIWGRKKGIEKYFWRGKSLSKKPRRGGVVFFSKPGTETIRSWGRQKRDSHGEKKKCKINDKREKTRASAEKGGVLV